MSEKTLEQLQADALREAKAAEFEAKAKSSLDELMKKVEDTATEYEKYYNQFRDDWEGMNKCVVQLKSDIECKYKSTWRQYLEKFCTKVICPIHKIRANLECRRGAPQNCKELGEYGLEKVALVQWTSWQGISASIQAQFTQNQKLEEDIRKLLGGCNESHHVLYLFYFLLWPAHQLLYWGPNGPADYKDEPTWPEIAAPENEYCKNCPCHPVKLPAESGWLPKPNDAAQCPPPAQAPDECCDHGLNSTCNLPDRFKGSPWIVQPDKYKGHLVDAFEIYGKWGNAVVNLNLVYDQIETLAKDFAAKNTLEYKKAQAEIVMKKNDSPACNAAVQ